MYLLPLGLPPYVGHFSALRRCPCAPYSMFSLVISFIRRISSVWCQSQPLSSPHPCLRLWYPHIGSLCLCLYFCFANKVISVIFSRSHIYALTHDICFSDLLHSASRSLGFRVGNRICSSSLWSINYVILAISSNLKLAKGCLAYRLLSESGMWYTSGTQHKPWWYCVLTT